MGRDELQECNSRRTVIWGGMNYKNVTAEGLSFGTGELQECNSRRTILCGRDELEVCNSRSTVIWGGMNYKNVTVGLSFGTG